jgi:hypothetical protein
MCHSAQNYLSRNSSEVLQLRNHLCEINRSKNHREPVCTAGDVSDIIHSKTSKEPEEAGNQQ